MSLNVMIPPKKIASFLNTLKSITHGRMAIVVVRPSYISECFESTSKLRRIVRFQAPVECVLEYFCPVRQLKFSLTAPAWDLPRECAPFWVGHHC